MDFHRLSRRDLQALCKRNKIPANMTNASMADSLKSLHNVEGIDEFLQVCESEMAQASIESGMRSEVASPFMPPTGGRSTHMTPAPKSRRRAVKEDSTVKKVCGTRRSARLAEKSARLLKGVEDGNSDFSKKGLFIDELHQVLKVNLKENLDESDEISGVTDVSERANMGENSEKNDEEQVDSAEKQDIATDIEENRNHFNTKDGDKTDTKEHSNEKAQVEVFPCEKEVITTVEEVHLVPNIQEIKNTHSGAGEEAELGEKEHNLVEIKEQGAGSENSDLQGVDAITIVVADSDQKAHEEVVQCEKEVVSVEEVKLELTVEEEKSTPSRADDAKTELKDTNVEIEQEGCGSEIDANPELKNTDVEIEQEDCDSETDIEFDATDVETEGEDCGSEIDSEFDAKTELKDVDVETEGEGCGSEIDSESDAKTELKDTDLETEGEGFGSEIHSEFDDIEVSETDTRLKDNTSVDASTDVESEGGMHEDSSETESNLDESDSDSSETKSTESSYSLAAEASDDYTTDKEVPVIEAEQVIPHVVVQERKETGGAIDRAPSVEATVDNDLPLTINAKNVPSPIPASASKTSSVMQEIMAAASNNKENIGNASKTKTRILIKDVKEAAVNLDEIVKLSKKLEEVGLTKNGCVNEVSGRPALQPLPHNQKMG